MAIAQEPRTPDHGGFALLKTPDGLIQTHEASAGVAPWSTRFRWVGTLAQLLVFACIGVYIFGEVLVLTPLYTNKLVPTIQGWWGVPLKQVKGQTKGHSEMTRPTYFTLFGVLPVVVSVVLIEFLRNFNVRRLSSSLLLKAALVLRRKPTLFGRVSHWSLGEMLFFLALVLGNVFVFVRYYISRVHKKNPKKFEKYLECVGLTFGYTCLFNMAFLFLPATRNCAWMEFFNISYANGIKYHRWLGVVTLLTGFLHCVAYYWAWTREGEWIKQALPCFGCNISEKQSSKRWENFFGELAFLIFIVMSLAAIPVVRRKFYNVFYYTHQLLFVAIIFLALHWQYVIWFLLPTFVVYCVGRAISGVNAFAPVQVKELRALSPSLVKLVFQRAAGRDGHYKVGQFLYLNVPALSKLQWHAFTVASSPRSSPTTVTVLLKGLGDWTTDLVNHAYECEEKNVQPTVHVDGFYGASLEMYSEYSTLCLIGGGIGVTPILSILEDLTAKLSTSHEPLTQRVVFVFTFRELALLEQLAPVLAKLRELDPQQQLVSFHLTNTGLPSDEQLDAKFSQPSLVASAKSNEAHAAFAAPLQSRAFKSIAYVASFFVVILLVVVLEYGTKIERLNAKLWALQQFVEIAVLMASAAVTTVAVIFAERMMRGRGGVASGSKSEFAAVETPSLQSLNVLTYRELLAELGVAIGAQPDVAALLQQTHAQHLASPEQSKTPIGVFASGPESLKRAVELAIAQIDSSAFDLRQEQFEL